MNADFVILGGGLAGLGCARALPSARVFEAKPHAGGHVYSHAIGGAHFDEGAHICHARDKAWLDLITARAGGVVRVPRSRVANWWHGHWVTYPVQNHLRDLPVGDRIAALTDLVVAQSARDGREPANYEEWLLSQYGEYLTRRFYAEYTAKYWRVPMAELGTDWLGGRLLPSQLPRIVAGAFTEPAESQAVFNEFLYPARGGFFGFFAPLYDGVDLTCGARAVAIDPARRIVRFADGGATGYRALASSIPLPELVAMTGGAPDAIRDAASRLRHTQLLCVAIVVRKAALTPHHWFYIYDPGIEVARVKVISNVTPDAVPPGCTVLQAEIYRRGDEALDPSRLAGHAVGSLGRMLGFRDEDVVTTGRIHATHAYPISDLNRARAATACIDWLATQRIHTMGLFGRWQFIWSDAAYASGEETARRMLAPA